MTRLGEAGGKVSVVMPAFNAERFISATIESVLAQTLPPFELLVIDDFSKDRTVEVVQKYVTADSRVRLIRLPINHGAPAAPRNLGVNEARGDWIAFVDADDLWHPRKLELQLACVRETGALFCSTQMRNFTGDETLRLPEPDAYSVERIGFLKQLFKNRTPTSSVFVRKEVVARHKFNVDPRFKAKEDFDCWLRCHQELGWSVKIAHPLVGYRVNPGQISGRKWMMTRRHLFVLRRFKLKSGRGLGLGALLFTVTHSLLAVYERLVKRGM